MSQFNIRVYGLLINEREEVLVSDEKRNGLEFTKFPGGGLQFGEGIKDCLKREFFEELGIKIEIQKLFYLTDFFQVSAFNKEDQIISIYYLISSDSHESITVNRYKKFDTSKENHRWLTIKDISTDDFLFPVDKIVVEKLYLLC